MPTSKIQHRAKSIFFFSKIISRDDKDRTKTIFLLQIDTKKKIVYVGLYFYLHQEDGDSIMILNSIRKRQAEAYEVYN